MKTNLKKCDCCEQERPIWKNYKGLKYCKYCWYSDKKNKTSIPKKSSKQRVRDESYSLIRKAFLIKNPICQACLEGCTITAGEVHHMKGRIGPLLLDISNYLAVCRECHKIIEENPEMAKKLNLSKSRLKND